MTSTSNHLCNSFLEGSAFDIGLIAQEIGIPWTTLARFEHHKSKVHNTDQINHSSLHNSMERLLEREESGRPWSLQNDRDLLEALSDLSSDLMSRMHRLDSDLADLETNASTISARLGNASASFSGLCHSQFIEQVDHLCWRACSVGTPHHKLAGQHRTISSLWPLNAAAGTNLCLEDSATLLDSGV